MSYPTMLILSPEVIDKNFIIPSLNQNLHSIDDWRDLFAQRIGLKSFSDMSLRKAILIDARTLNGFIGNVSTQMRQLSTWYVPEGSRGELYMSIESFPDSDPELHVVSSSLAVYESTPWEKGTTFLKLGNICISKADAKKLIADYEEKLEYGDIEGLEPPTNGDPVSFVERGAPYDFWAGSHDFEKRREFLNCQTLPGLYALLCDFMGVEAEEVFASYGFTIHDFVEEILNDEDCRIVGG